MLAERSSKGDEFARYRWDLEVASDERGVTGVSLADWK
jgi:hypothetical protein